jgi:XTP/dITP diphosphohydrolase
MKRIRIGTTSRAKALEIASIITARFTCEVTFEPPSDAGPEETGNSLQENAIIKALHYSKGHSDITLSEDTGIFCDGLDDAPGHLSARFARKEYPDLFSGELDKKNAQKVLDLLQGNTNRKAQFRTCFVLAQSGVVIAETEAITKGLIAQKMIGEENTDFAYDTIFMPDTGFGSTFAEMDKFRKNMRSFRKDALLHLLWEQGFDE